MSCIKLKKVKNLADGNLFEKQKAFYKKWSLYDLFYALLNYTVLYYVLFFMIVARKNTFCLNVSFSKIHNYILLCLSLVFRSSLNNFTLSLKKYDNTKNMMF